MRRSSFAVVPALALAVAAQSFAHDSAWLVCRYSGEVMASCECVQERHDRGASPAIDSEGCCLVVRSEVAVVPALVKARAIAQSRTSVELAVVPDPYELFRSSTGTRRLRQRAPPSTPVYVTLRALLV